MNKFTIFTITHAVIRDDSLMYGKHAKSTTEKHPYLLYIRNNVNIILLFCGILILKKNFSKENITSLTVTCKILKFSERMLSDENNLLAFVCIKNLYKNRELYSLNS